jgi:hypothetical protein
MASGDRDTSRLLDIQGVNIPHIGYGKMVQGLRGALANHVTLDENAEHVVFALRPNLIKGWDDGRIPHCLTMWETNWLPPEFSEYLSEFKKVIVPSLHNWELFSQYHDEVHMIPLGVDRTVWRPVEREPNKKFRFMCGGSEWFRKGMDVVLEAFTSLNLPNCELHIKIVPPYLYAPKNLDYPNVVVHREWMSVEDEANLVRSADCFISVARGEGFGLMPLQAISAGVPTIVSDAHGHREFSDLAAARVPTVSVPTTKGEWQNMGDWDEPDMEVLCEKMVDIYENYEGYKWLAGLKADYVDAFSFHVVNQVWVWATSRFSRSLRSSLLLRRQFRGLLLRVRGFPNRLRFFHTKTPDFFSTSRTFNTTRCVTPGFKSTLCAPIVA